MTRNYLRNLLKDYVFEYNDNIAYLDIKNKIIADLFYFHYFKRKNIKDIKEFKIIDDNIENNLTLINKAILCDCLFKNFIELDLFIKILKNELNTVINDENMFKETFEFYSKQDRFYFESVFTTQLICYYLKRDHINVIFPQKVELMSKFMRVNTDHPFINNNNVKIERYHLFEREKLCYIIKPVISINTDYSIPTYDKKHNYKNEIPIRRYDYINNFFPSIISLLIHMNVYNNFSYIGRLFKYGVKFILSCCDYTFNFEEKRIRRKFRKMNIPPEYIRLFNSFLSNLSKELLS